MKTSIRHELCFQELLNYDRRGTFLGKHPLVGSETEAERIAKLLRSDPDAFLQEYSNARQNVARYSSFLNSASRSDVRKQRDRASLEKWTSVVEIYAAILKNNVK